LEDDASLLEVAASITVLLESAFGSTGQVLFTQLPVAVGRNSVAAFSRQK